MAGVKRSRHCGISFELQSTVASCRREDREGLEDAVCVLFVDGMVRNKMPAKLVAERRMQDKATRVNRRMIDALDLLWGSFMASKSLTGSFGIDRVPWLHSNNRCDESYYLLRSTVMSSY